MNAITTTTTIRILSPSWSTSWNTIRSGSYWSRSEPCRMPRSPGRHSSESRLTHCSSRSPPFRIPSDPSGSFDSSEMSSKNAHVGFSMSFSTCQRLCVAVGDKTTRFDPLRHASARRCVCECGINSSERPCRKRIGERMCRMVRSECHLIVTNLDADPTCSRATSRIDVNADCNTMPRTRSR